MNPEHVTLWERILAFDIDGEHRSLSFTARLARENGWSVGFAERVVLEYKRFVCLALTAGHPVTPSDQVDQAWHLHLTYSRSYWERFCGEVLGRPLHHEPTKGGSAEGEKFDAQYRQTLASYRTAFGHEPPSDIWPPSEIRFGDDLHFVRVNTRRNRVVPRIGLLLRSLLPVLLVVALFSASGAAPAVSSHEQRLKEGAGALAAFMGAALVVPMLFVGLRIRKKYRTPPADAPPIPETTVHDIAYLKGGWKRAMEVTVGRLVRDGVFTYNAATRRLQAVTPLEAPHHPVERVIHTAVATQAAGATIRDVRRAARANGAGGFEPLFLAGLAHSPAKAAVATRLPTAVVASFAAVVLGGVITLGVLLQSFPAVAFGAAFLLAWWIVLGIVLPLKCRRTYRGDEAIARAEEQAEATGSRKTDVPTAIALSGLAACSLPLAAALLAFFTMPPAVPVSTTVSSDSGSGGCSGCGGGCGGCGGCGG